MSFDTNGLNLRSNEGAAVINDLVSSENTYDLSIGTSVDTAGGNVAVDAMNNPANYPYAFDQVANRNCKCGAPTETPKQGITDQIAVNPNLVYKDSQHRTVLLSSEVFHELAEAYAKIDGGKPYSDYQIIGVGGAGTTLQVFAPQSGAHNIAVQRENQLRNERPNLQDTGRAGDSLVRDTHN